MAKEKSQYGVVEGVIVYAKIAQPDLKFQSKDTEFSIGVIVNEDTADAWDEQFKKQPATKIKATDFEAKFKFPLPAEFKGEKNVFQIKLKRDAVVNGEPFYPDNYPKVFLDTADERIDITHSRLIANGSRGKVSYRINSNDFGTFARLNNVLFDEKGFIEYESKGGGGVGSEFGNSKPVKVEPAKESVTQARQPREVDPEEEPKKAAAPAQKVVAPAQNADFDDSDIPFANPYRGRICLAV